MENKKRAVVENNTANPHTQQCVAGTFPPASDVVAVAEETEASNTQLQTCPRGVKPARDEAALAKETQAIAKDDTAHTASSRSHDDEDSPNSQTITAGTSSTRCRDLFVAHDKLRFELSSELASLKRDIQKMRCKALDAINDVAKHVPSAGLLELQRTSNLTIANTDELWKNICAKADEISLVQNQIMSDVNDLTRDVVDVATHQLESASSYLESLFHLPETDDKIESKYRDVNVTLAQVRGTLALAPEKLQQAKTEITKLLQLRRDFVVPLNKHREDPPTRDGTEG